MIEQFYSSFGYYPIIAVFLTTLLFGEEGIFFVCFLSGGGLIPFWLAYVLGNMGSILGDFFWYNIARSGFAGKIAKRFIRKDKENRKIVKKIGPRKIFSLLAISKCFTGSRLFMIFYANSQEKKFWRIFGINTLALLAASAFFGTLGWVMGKLAIVQFKQIMGINNLIGIFVVILILTYFLKKIGYSIVLGWKK